MSGTAHPAADLERTHRTVEQRLGRGGYRYTRGRRELVEVLARTNRPVAIGEIIAEGEGISQSSAYRNLLVLEQARVVRRILTPHQEGGMYELDESLTAHHHHLVCRSCGAVEDFHPSRPVERALERSVAEASRTGGFSADHHRLDLVGTCGSCR